MNILWLLASGANVASGASEEEVSIGVSLVVKLTFWEVTAFAPLLADLAL